MCVWEQIGSKHLKWTFTAELAASGKRREVGISGTQIVSSSGRGLKEIRWLTPGKILLLLPDDNRSPEPEGLVQTPPAVSPNTREGPVPVSGWITLVWLKRNRTQWENCLQGHFLLYPGFPWKNVQLTGCVCLVWEEAGQSHKFCWERMETLTLVTVTQAPPSERRGKKLFMLQKWLIETSSSHLRKSLCCAAE